MTGPLALGKFRVQSSAGSILIFISRWLVHSIASYYGLHTWSITVGEPARREAYVGFHMPAPGSRPGLTTHVSVPSNAQQGAMIKPGDDLPKPLWAQI